MKTSMPETASQTSQVFELGSTTDAPKLRVLAGLLELPRRNRMKTADIGIPETDYSSIATGYASGDRTNAEVCERFLQVFLEMMSRTPNPGPRILQDPFGKATTGAKGGTLAKNCSEFAIDHDDCGAANFGSSNPKAVPGHWKTFVTDHWPAIMPQLVFTSEVANPGNAAADLQYNEATWKEVWKKNTSDSNVERKKLLGWLVPFLKDPVTKWDGTK